MTKSKTRLQWLLVNRGNKNLNFFYKERKPSNTAVANPGEGSAIEAIFNVISLITNQSYTGH